MHARLEKKTKKEPIIIFGMKQTKTVHQQHGIIDSWEDRIYLHGRNTYINNNKLNQ